MKIAQVAPVGERVPPKKYGGTERVVHALTEELVKRGHDVTLFASGDSTTSANLVASVPKALREAGSQNPYGAEYLSMLNIGTAYKAQSKFDVIHDHNVYLSLPTAILATTPVVMTLHGAIDADSRRFFENLNNKHNPFFVSISYSQRLPLPNLNYIGNVYHGLEMTDYPYSKESDGYLLFVGRISPEKGVHHAIEVAEYLDIPLIIAAKLDPADKKYFKKFIEPRLSEKIQWIGEVDQEKRNYLMSKALCFLHPVQWREPFGLTMIEAMACACPVVAFRRGSIPEIVKDKKTGYIVEDSAEMIEAVKNIHKIDRQECRKHALSRFNAEKMTDEYIQIYKSILSDREKKKMKIEGKNGKRLKISYSEHAHQI